MHHGHPSMEKQKKTHQTKQVQNIPPSNNTSGHCQPQGTHINTFAWGNAATNEQAKNLRESKA
jgi:hypothetical protein